jgi:hypothetical protein
MEQEGIRDVRNFAYDHRYPSSSRMDAAIHFGLAKDMTRLASFFYGREGQMYV